MTEFLLPAFLFLLAGVISVPIASRLGLGSVLGYLIAGIVLSPVLTLLGVDVIQVQHFAEFGVVMMLFLVGLELEPKLLWAMRMRLLGLGGLQVGLTTALIAAAAYALGSIWQVALAIGLIFALSSTAIVLQTLNEKGLMKSDGGQAGFSVLLFQDIAVIPMLALLPLLATQHVTHEGGDAHASLSLVDGLNGWQTGLATLAAIGMVVAGGMYLTRPAFRFIAHANLREVFIAAALAFVIGIALLMTLVGLSPALGTFLAGVVLANSEYRHELESDIDPFRGLLLGLFFMTVGAGIDFGLLAAQPLTIAALTLGVIALKAGVLLFLAWVFGVRDEQGWLFGMSLAQAGEFGFVLISFATAGAILPDDIAPRLTLIVTLSMMLTPGLFILYDRVVLPRYHAAEPRAADDIDQPGHVIIAGHGRFGGVVNRMLLSSGHETTVLDHSSNQLEALRAFGVRAFYGDATRPDLLHAAGIENARLLVVAIDDRNRATEMVRHVVKHHPHIHVVARALDRSHVYELWGAGCRDIIRDTFDSAVRAGRSTLEALGMHPFEAERTARTFVNQNRRSMRELADLYDPEVPNHRNAPYRDRARALMDEQTEELRSRGRGAHHEGADGAWARPTLRDQEAALRKQE
ncbi:monovalent cation:proton antiporter-2 (CPA2) family protein [Paracoccus sp. 1_MG-2023]|uniref:monovalent cation:proton antiporter-2 (CPA2) family protein n=1 Tax=unclassified Paracoccus (in: a-proteobacteria) TaxID=2688777 RepID=UPI001C0A5793|nr:MULTISPECIES: monovalent cation:proton antiporter-2 (CPA2) family protein [unclassified Paracoccus (in: a-proteobacteria)]MBU2956080.1 monovalent cation:proton antiporter-2 (CPA2) family protein [Paracoccus sp. C2R09]MDO6669486.1 monovalent cation:proton antiporter-2 (CPA2) family protein [Paracoccus sp. 1_MG-2023]